MDSSETQNVISLCTGYDGISMGLRKAGLDFRTRLYVEIECYVIANLVDKIEKDQMDAAPIWSDLKTFDAQPFRDKIHGIISGYPCQPWSYAGKRQGTEDPRHLWPYIRDHIETIRPVWCFFENVSGHLTLGFDEVCRSLWELGYSVEAGMFTASECGAAHQRKRLFILAYSNNYAVRPIARGNGKTSGIQKEHRAEICRGDVDGTGEQLADTSSVGLEGNIGGASERHRLAGGSTEKLVDANSEGLSGNGHGNSEQRGQEHKEGNRDRVQHRATDSGVYRAGKDIGQLADTDSSRSSKNRKSSELRTSGIEQSSCDSGETNAQENVQGKWPSRPGETQHDWEHPRTIKSNVGCTIDGYNARVDMLRLLGNGVYPDTAALAWITLNERMARNFK